MFAVFEGKSALPKVIGDSRSGGRCRIVRNAKLYAMTIDRLRLAESSTEAVLVLGAVALPAAARVIGPGLLAVLAAMALMLTTGVYALHAVTFDCFRLTGQRAERIFVSTRSED
jgi:hypothetical protein